MARDITINDAYYASRRVIRPDGYYYTAPFSNIHQSISAHDYTRLKILCEVQTYDNTTVDIRAHCIVAGSNVTIYGVCREIADGNINGGSWYFASAAGNSEFLTYGTTLAVGYNKITGSFVRTETGSAIISLYYREEF